MVGIFDSGSGGMSVFREIFKLLPREKYVYYSDNAFCPYGEKTSDFVIERSHYITQFLIDKGCQTIVVACNTATSAAIASLRESFPSVAFIGMEPAVKTAASSTRSGIIGVLATAGTLSGDKYLIKKGIYKDSIRIEEHIGEGFVDLVERGELSGPHATEVVRKSLQPLLDAGADIIVLGCTHYPFLIPLIQEIAGPQVQIIDPAPAIAKRLATVLDIHEAPSTNPAEDSIKTPDLEMISSGDPTSLERIYSLIFKN